jgi:hypothetical protein
MCASACSLVDAHSNDRPSAIWCFSALLFVFSAFQCRPQLRQIQSVRDTTALAAGGQSVQERHLQTAGHAAFDSQQKRYRIFSRSFSPAVGSSVLWRSKNATEPSDLVWIGFVYPPSGKRRNRREVKWIVRNWRCSKRPCSSSSIEPRHFERRSHRIRLGGPVHAFVTRAGDQKFEPTRLGGGYFAPPPI